MFRLGNVTFEKAILTPHSEGYSKSHTYAEMKPATGKPILQRKGANLTETSISMLFHISFCNPSEQITALVDAMDSGLVCPYFWEDGAFKGNFVILDVRIRVEKRFPDGGLMAATVDVDLKEYSEAQFLKSVKKENETPETPDPDKEVKAPVKKAGKQPFKDVTPDVICRQSYNDAREVLQDYEPGGESRL